MADSQICTLAFEDFIQLEANHYAFSATPTPRDMASLKERKPYQLAATHWAAYENDVAQATCSHLRMTENLRGQVYPMGGMGGVASLPQGRRKGHVRKMLVAVFERMHEQGLAISTLYPFRDSFYERLGYAEFPKPRFVALDPSQLGDLVRAQLPGEVIQRDMAASFDDYWAFLERFQETQHGFARFERTRGEEAVSSNDRWVAMVKEGDTFTGAMVFRITGYGEELVVDRFLTLTTAARYQLLAWIGRHVDQVREAVVQLPPDALPELWARDLQADTFTKWREAWVAPMGRVIEVSALGGMTVGDGTVCVSIVDDQCPWNAGDWTFTGEGGVLTVTRGGSPDGHLTSQGLASLLWNGTDPAILPYRGWGDPGEAAATALREMFPPVMPYLATQF